MICLLSRALQASPGTRSWAARRQAAMSCEPGPPALEAELTACVNDSLRLYLHDNARFMCERLVAEFPSPVRSNCCEQPSARGCGAGLGCLIHVWLLRHWMSRLLHTSLNLLSHRPMCTCWPPATSDQTRPIAHTTCCRVRPQLASLFLSISGLYSGTCNCIHIRARAMQDTTSWQKCWRSS